MTLGLDLANNDTYIQKLVIEKRHSTFFRPNYRTPPNS